MVNGKMCLLNYAQITRPQQPEMRDDGGFADCIQVYIIYAHAPPRERVNRTCIRCCGSNAIESGRMITRHDMEFWRCAAATGTRLTPGTHQNAAHHRHQDAGLVFRELAYDSCSARRLFSSAHLRDPLSKMCVRVCW